MTTILIVLVISWCWCAYEAFTSPVWPYDYLNEYKKSKIKKKKL
jgi:hypothetical protein